MTHQEIVVKHNKGYPISIHEPNIKANLPQNLPDHLILILAITLSSMRSRSLLSSNKECRDDTTIANQFASSR